LTYPIDYGIRIHNLTNERNTVMQPLRKDHVDHYKEFVRDEFSIASNHVEQEITQQAYDKVEEVGTQFAKELKLEKLISEMGKRDKALRDFQSKKQSMEYDLQRNAQEIADQISEIFNNKRKQRKWDMSSVSVQIKDDHDAVDYIHKKIKKACYEEAEAHARAKHKLYHALEGKKKKCMNILYTGSHIQPTLVELKKEMATANIVLDLPNSLLALPQGSK